MINEKNYAVNDILKNCLIELDFIFQWLAMTENKKLKTEYAEMGSNFAKYKIIKEYINFIQPACQAEIHFSNGDFPECAERCRNSMGEFIKYLYDINKWEKPIGKIVPGEPSLDQLIKGSDLESFLKQHGTKDRTYSKKYGNDATHQPYSETDINDAFKCLNDLFYLITQSLPEKDKKFAGTQRFDISLLKNNTKEFITPLLTIENNGKEVKIPQNGLLIAVLKKKVPEAFIKENLSLINKTDVLGNTPLSLAVYNDDYDTVKLLLDNGADPNFYFKNYSKDFHKSVNDEISKDEARYSGVWSDYIEAHRCIPLIIAIKKDNSDIVRLLLKYSAKTWDSCIDDFFNIAKIPTECSTLLTCAIFYNANACVNMLLDEDILDNSGKKIEILIDPKWTDTPHTFGTIEGVTALMLAAENENFDVVDQLLDKGARLDVLDKCRNSVFLHAVQNKRKNNVLGKLLREGEKSLGKEKLAELINHAGFAGFPLSHVNDVNDAKLLLKYGADVNAKNERGVSCIADTALISPELIPWMKKHGAKLNFKEFKELFLKNNYLEIKYEMRRFFNAYSKEQFNRILNSWSDLLTPEILNLNVPIDNIPQISPLINSIIFSKARNIQMDIDYRDEKQEKCFLFDEQLTELNKKYPLIRLLSKNLSNGKLLSYSHIRENYNALVKWVNEGFSGSKLDVNIDMTLEDVYQAVASERELSKKQKIELFKKYPFIKNLEMAGIDPNDQSEVESTFNAEKIILESLGETINWEMNPADIKNAIIDIKSTIPYEDFKISPLDDALIAKNYDAAAIYLSKEIQVSQFTKLLLLSVHKLSEKKLDGWKKVLTELGSRNDIDFTDVLLLLCKNHPKEDFDIAKEFINNGYNFYRFANHVLPGFVNSPNYDYKKQYIRNNDGTDNMSPSIDDIRIRNNKEFLSFFDEQSFQDVNLRLIKNAISLGADFNAKDKLGKSALDYAKQQGLDEALLLAERQKNQAEKVEIEESKITLSNGVLKNLRPDKADTNRIFDGQIVACDGKIYNFKQMLFNSNHQAVEYNSSYVGRAVTFHITKESTNDKPGWADQVTLDE